MKNRKHRTPKLGNFSESVRPFDGKNDVRKRVVLMSCEGMSCLGFKEHMRGTSCSSHIMNCNRSQIVENTHNDADFNKFRKNMIERVL